MAVANAGCLLAEAYDPSETSTDPAEHTRLPKRQRRVLMIDWDLDAPGLHYFFGPATAGPDKDRQPGLMELFSRLRKSLSQSDKGVGADASRAAVEEVALDDFILETGVPSLHLMKAGRFDNSYFSRVRRFGWQALYGRAPQVFQSFIERLAAEYHYVLVDSRTGETDIGGICTALLPEKLVLVFTPSVQSLDGLLRVARRAVEFRRQADDLRPLALFPLPSRIELNEPELQEAWRMGDSIRGILGYQPQFERLFSEVYSLPECNLQGYFSEVQIQHIPSYAYGEQVAATVESRGGRLSLRRSYENFTDRLVNLAAPWKAPIPSASDRHAFRLPPGPPLAGAGSQHVEPIELAHQVAQTHSEFLLRSVIRRTRSHFAQAWPNRISDLITRERGKRPTVTDDQVYDVCLPHIRRFADDITLVEIFGLALVEAEQHESVRELLSLIEDWISMSERLRPGYSVKPIQGAPGILALRTLLNWSAKAATNDSVDVLRVTLAHSLSTEGEQGSGTTGALVDRRDLFYPEALLGRADLAVRYVDEESWMNPGMPQLFVSQQDYWDGLAIALFLIALIWNARNPHDSWRPLYPGYKLVSGSARAIRAFLQRISPAMLGFVAAEAGEDVDTFRANWPTRSRELSEASLGGRLDLFRAEFDLPKTI